MEKMSGGAQWFRTTKNRDVNTGPFAHLFVCLFTRSLPSLRENDLVLSHSGREEWFSFCDGSPFVFVCFHSFIFVHNIFDSYFLSVYFFFRTGMAACDGRYVIDV